MKIARHSSRTVAFLVLATVAAGVLSSGASGKGGGDSLRIRTSSPATGHKVSGAVSWQVSVLKGSPSQIAIYVDGA